jgi:putative restriction endonuclease
MQDKINHYSGLISRMRTAGGQRLFPATTRHRAPHKPILLLSIIDFIDQGQLTTNFVSISVELTELFSSYWNLVMPDNRIGRLFMPFFYMKSDGFWHLIPHHGQEDALESIQQIAGPGQLRDTVLGGRFDAELYELFCIKEVRDILRAIIIETYFAEDVWPVLLKQADVNVNAYQYSLELLEQARSKTPGVKKEPVEDRQLVRDQGFRKAVVTAYDHRCVMCGVRLVTLEGRTAATAAHIIPWSVSYNDDPRNGLCLCRLCHWTFDIGLSTITAKYRIRLSHQLNAAGNMPGYLSTLNDRSIFEPVEDVFNPDIEALEWHLNEVFLD